MNLVGKGTYSMRYSSKFLILLFLFFTNYLYTTDSSSLEFDGLQMAWVKLPKETSKEESVPTKKTQATITEKPVAAPTTKPPTQPTPPAVIEPSKPAVQSVPPAATVPLKPLSPPTVRVPPKPTILVPANSSVAKPVDRINQGTNLATMHTSQELQWMIGLGIDVGGDGLGKVYFADGSAKPVNANQGYVLNVGTLLRNGKSRTFSTQLSVGYKLGGQWGDNGSVTWRSIPIEVIEFYQTENMRVGLGLGYQLKPRLEVSIPSSSYTDQYNNALGMIAQLGWSPAKGHFSIDLRYTVAKFQSNSASNNATVKGNVAGLYTSYKF